MGTEDCTIDLPSVNQDGDTPQLKCAVSALHSSPRSLSLPIDDIFAASQTKECPTFTLDCEGEYSSQSYDDIGFRNAVLGEPKMHDIDLEDGDETAMTLNAHFEQKFRELHSAFSTALYGVRKAYDNFQQSKKMIPFLQYTTSAAATYGAVGRSKQLAHQGIVAITIPMEVEHVLTGGEQELSLLLQQNMGLQKQVTPNNLAMRVSHSLTLCTLFFMLNRRVIVALERKRDACIAVMRDFMRRVVRDAHAAPGADAMAQEAFGRRQKEMVEIVECLDVRRGLSSEYRGWFESSSGGNSLNEHTSNWLAITDMNHTLQELSGKIEVLDKRCMYMDILVRKQMMLLGKGEMSSSGIEDSSSCGVPKTGGANDGKGGTTTPTQNGGLPAARWWSILGTYVLCTGLGIGAVFYATLV